MKNKILQVKSLNTDVAALFLRVIFGGLFMYHGWTKIMSFDQMLTQFPDLIGIGGQVSFILVIFAEFLCGLLIALGVLTRLAAIPIFINMTVAYFIAHASDTFRDKELPFTFLLLSIVVFVLGSGRISVDGLFRR